MGVRDARVPADRRFSKNAKDARASRQPFFARTSSSLISRATKRRRRGIRPHPSTAFQEETTVASHRGQRLRVLAVIWPNTAHAKTPRASGARGVFVLFPRVSASAHATRRAIPTSYRRAIPTTSKELGRRLPVAVRRRHRREVGPAPHRRHSHPGAGRSKRTR